MQFLLFKVTIFFNEIVFKDLNWHPYGNFQFVFNALLYSFKICDKIMHTILDYDANKWWYQVQLFL